VTAELAAAVFLDRDGTVIEDLDYPRDPERVRLLGGAADGLRRLRDRGFRLVVVSNQSGIGRGIVTSAQAVAVHQRFIGELAREGVELDAAKYCPHAPWEGCNCRKPKTSLLHEAAGELGLDLPSSFIVGDKPTDVEAGRKAGCRAVLYSPSGDVCDHADHVARSWREVRNYILAAGAAR
jgi:D-glycero-D-manno-heptose 1,7-bisphosphate phosphatase